MAKTLFLLFNHQFTQQQEADARSTLGVDGIEPMPEALKPSWGEIPPDAAGIRDHLQPFRDWLSTSAGEGDFVLIQGDFGATYLMVRYVSDCGWIPVYATTRREAQEAVQSDGSVKMYHHFRHVRFRRYGD